MPPAGECAGSRRILMDREKKFLKQDADAEKNCALLLSCLHGNLSGSQAESPDISELSEPYRELGRELLRLHSAVDEMKAQITEGEEQLRRAAEKAGRRAEIIESYNELLIDMLGRRKEWLLVVDRDSKEIIYCNKRKQIGTSDTSFCQTCKRRLSFQHELMKWSSDERYSVWEMNGEAGTSYRVTSFPMEWKGCFSYVHVVVDITDEKRNARHLSSKAYHDPLTGVKNRLFFEEYMSIVLRDELEATICYLQLDGLDTSMRTSGMMKGTNIFRILWRL